MRPTGLGTLPALVIVLLGAALLVMGLATGLHLRRRIRLLALTERLTKAHATLLIVKRRQLLKHDGYGNVELGAWIAHVDYFIDNVVLREARTAGIGVAGTAAGQTLRAEITRRFLSIVNTTEPGVPTSHAADAIASGQRYETLCQNALEAAGWRVAATPVTGDQGADLIADAAGQRVVVQCKFHAKPVGNKAVQEAYTARNLHGADHAVVVSNNSYTRSAVELARANDVLLLHHDQLPTLAGQLSAARAKPRGHVFDAGRTR